VKRLVIQRDAIRNLQRIPNPDRERVTSRIEALAEEPPPANLDVLKLTQSDAWRLRVGNWRVIFEMTDTTVEILNVLPRGRAYR
jgi:mRNA interferase RelE/StbE